MESPQVTAIAKKDDQTLLKLRLSGDQPNKVVGQGIAWLWEKGESPLANAQFLDDTGATIVTQVLTSSLTAGYVAAIQEFAAAFGIEVEVRQKVDGLGCITIAGEGFQQSPEDGISQSLGQPGAFEIFR